MKNKAKYFLYSMLVLLAASSFVLKSVPAPPKSPALAAGVPYGGAYVVFAGKFGGEVTKNEIAGQSDLKVEGCAKGSRIFEFSLHITKGGKTTVLKNRSNLLTTEMTTVLKSLSKGDEFEFRNAKAYLPNSKDVVDVHGRKFVVV